MAINKVSLERQSDDDLPWVNDYVDETGNVDHASKVTRFVKSRKGYIVICEDFKGFVFGQSRMYDFLEEAIAVWKQDGKLEFGIFGIANKQGKLEIGTDDEYECTVSVDKKGNVDVKWLAGESQSSQPTSNPFLKNSRTSPPTTPSSAGKEKSSTGRKKEPF